MTQIDPDLAEKLMQDAETADEAEALLPLISTLKAMPSPQPTPPETERLLAALALAMPSPTETTIQRWRRRITWLTWLLQAQMRVVRSEIWLGSAFVMALGVLVTLSVNRQALPFVLIAPMVAAVGITFLYGPAHHPAHEIEMTTAVSPRLILLSRMTLLFGVDLLLGIAGSLILAAMRSDISFLPLIQTWLAPMAFLSAFAFFFSVISFEPLLGIMLSLILWGVQTMRQFDLLFRLPPSIPNLLLAQWQPWLWLAALLLSGTAVFLAGRESWVIQHG